MDISKLLSNATNVVTRAVQFTEEKLFNVEKTAYDSHTENLMMQTDQCQLLTEKIVKAIENFIQPNPAYRLENMVYEKIDVKRINHTTPASIVGESMLNMSVTLKSSPSQTTSENHYSSALHLVGECHVRLGFAQQVLVDQTRMKFIEPLQSYLDQVKNVQRERRELEGKRLDLDSAKAKLKRVVTEEAKRSETGETNMSAVEDMILVVERDLKNMQMEFDQQLEVTSLLMENVVASLDYHTRLLCNFVDCEAEYYEQCYEEVMKLKSSLKEF